MDSKKMTGRDFIVVTRLMEEGSASTARNFACLLNTMLEGQTWRLETARSMEEFRLEAEKLRELTDAIKEATMASKWSR